MSIDLLKIAIQNRTPITFEYAKTPGTRIGNPHALYVRRRKDGVQTTKLDVVQTAGVSESGKPFPSWRTLDLDQIRVIKTNDDEGPFEPSSIYNPSSDVYQFVIAKV